MSISACHTPIESCSLVPEQWRGLLQERYASVEAFYAVAQIHECHTALCRLLQTESERLDRVVEALGRTLPTQGADMAPAPVASGRMGCMPSVAEPVAQGQDVLVRTRAQVEMHGGAPEGVDLTPQACPIRDQGARGSCVAFSFEAVKEFWENRRSALLSPQWLYHACKQRDGRADEPGTYMAVAARCLEEIGICEETVWPYCPEQKESEHQGPPPSSAETDALSHRVYEAVRLPSPSVKDLKALMAYGENGQGGPIAYAVDLFPSIANAVTWQTGRIFDPLPGEQRIGGHAMALYGFQGDTFVTRQSWGTQWGAQSPYGAGWGTISGRYLEAEGRDFYWLRETCSAERSVAVAMCNRSGRGWRLPVLGGTALVAALAWLVAARPASQAVAGHRQAFAEASVASAAADNPPGNIRAAGWERFDEEVRRIIEFLGRTRSER